jgi:HK97 family phage portal protein
MEYLVAHMLLGGVAYLRPIYSFKKIPQEYWIEQPDLIAPIPSKDKNEWLAGWQYTDPNTGIKTTVPRETFIQFKQIDPGNFYTGMGAIQAAGRVIDTYNEGIDTQKVSMQNRGMKSGIFKPKSHLEKQQMDELRNRVRDIFLDKTARREPWVISDDLDWIETSQTPVELDYNQSQRELIRQMAAAIGIDPWWVGDRENSTYNNVAEARKGLYEDVGIPMLDDIKATLNLKIAPLYGEDIEINYDLSNVAALREDYSEKVTQAQTLWSLGVPMSQINSILEMGLEEYPGWDRTYLPFNVMPVSGHIEEETEGEKSYKSLTEEFKLGEWKRVDSRRVAYWDVLAKLFEPLYIKTGKAVIKAINTTLSIQKVESAINKMTDEWTEVITAAQLTIIEDFGKQTELRLKSIKPAECKFDPFSDYVMEWVKLHAAESVVSVLGTLKDDMGKMIAKCIEDGLSVRQTASVIREYYDDRSYQMAIRIARTETASAAGYAQHQTALDLGFTKKQWISARDARTRDSHSQLDGETRGINERYSNGLMYPGDPSGAAGEVINCRCIETWGR